MSFALDPWQLYFVILAGWVNRQQAEVIEYLRTGNQVLKENLGAGRILLSDDQRRRLAVKGRVLGRKRSPSQRSLFVPRLAFDSVPTVRGYVVQFARQVGVPAAVGSGAMLGRRRIAGFDL